MKSCSIILLVGNKYIDQFSDTLTMLLILSGGDNILSSFVFSLMISTMIFSD